MKNKPYKHLATYQQKALTREFRAAQKAVTPAQDSYDMPTPVFAAVFLGVVAAISVAGLCFYLWMGGE